MKTSNLFFPTLRQAPNDAELISHKLMFRAGLMRKLASGLYTWLPLGLKILKKIETIIRTEMQKINAQEILMPIVQPANLWEETDRWQKYGDMLLKMQDRHKRHFCFGPTHEEVVTDLIRNSITSYKQLPVCLYQIQTKFRDEIRPRFGVMRAREFLMKDAYSFHLSAECLNNTYNQMFSAYTNILNKLQLKFRAVIADNGDMGGNASHEFQVIAQSGEDQIVYSENSDYAANVEVSNLKGTPLEHDSTLKTARGIEVGHIFQLGDRYSKVMGAKVLDQHGTEQVLLMGCYGIGVSRLVAACIEQKHDENGIIWPDVIAPFKVVIVPIGFHQSEKIREFSINLYNQLQTNTTLTNEILLDDRDERPGVMFKDHELIGIPHRIVINEKLLITNQVEYKSRINTELKIISVTEILNYIS
ncbi:MAG: proline--tRNA ligase [Gammaproteobacteria bacterium]|jgi:prolyl-tRNA synthetase